MSNSVWTFVMLVAWFVGCSLISAFGVFLLRYLVFERSFRKALRYCIKYKWIIGLFSLGCTLISVIDMEIGIPYFSYILPFVVVVGTSLIAQGI